MVGIDTSVVLAQELLRRGAVVDYCDYSELLVSKDSKTYLSQIPILEIKNISLSQESPMGFSGGKKIVDAGNYDAIFQRMDPPVDEKYRKHCEHFSNLPKKIIQLNNPEWTWKLCEHLLPQDYPAYAIPTMECTSLATFTERIRVGKESVAKPRNLFGGQGIEFFKADEKEIVLEKYWNTWGPNVVVQPFLEEITQVGDLRILVMNLKVVGSVLRMPRTGSRLANLHQGATAHFFKPTQEQLLISHTVAKDLHSKGLYLLGLDFIGNFLSEVNITCPSAVPQINQVMGINAERLIIDELYALIKG